jgi:serine/threonine protein kinase
MPLAPGTHLGPYEIIAPLGAGGMGEVYRARDARLDRTVAIKILPPQFSSDPVRKQRFEREAKTISSLNHPHICVLHDIGHQDGTDYLVMECVEGGTLAKRLEKGPLTLDQVLKYGAQIADALDKAHRSSIVHRDLKPGNIMLTSTGAKLLDFGLAKPAVAPASVATLTAAATQTTPMTQEGTIVGTFQYMSPEQVEGKELDGRSDIFSLGAVLYEMLTGQCAFPGKSQLSVASAILEKEPASISTLKPMTPPALHHAIRRSLAKDPEERWQTARDLGQELRWIAESPPTVNASIPAEPQQKWRERMAWVTALAFALITLALAFGFFWRAPQPFPVLRSSLLPPQGSSFLPYNFCVSPDGTRLAFVALGPDGKTGLWVRALSAPGAQQLSGTEDATFPFWSLDSLHIGFFAEGRLKTVDLVSSAVHIVCDSPSGFGGTWNQEGIILFAPDVTGPLYSIPAGGGIPQAVTKIRPGSSQSHHWPSFLPDGKHFLYFVDWSDPADAQRNGIYVGSLDSATPKLISSELTGNAFFAAGNLLYVRDRTIMAQPFDTGRVETTGPAVPLTQQEVEKFSDFWQTAFSVSREGTLVFRSAADAPSRLVWYNSAGKELGQFPEVGYEAPQLSPDGRSLAVSSDDERNGKHFIRVYDLDRGVSTRVTAGGGESYPVWSRNSKSIVYRDAALNIEEVPADGSAPPRLIVGGTNVIPCDWSADGHLIYMSFAPGEALPTLKVFSNSDRKVTPIAELGAEAQFSPDGRWIAFLRLSSREVVVQSFPRPGARIQISNAVGSSQPRWSRDGKQIFYLQSDRKLMSVDFDPEKGSASPPRLITQTRIVATNFVLFQYAISPDGRFLVNSLPTSNSSPLTLITRWDTLVPRR